MSSLNKGRATEVTSPRDLEKEFISMAKLFAGRETEQNWEARDASVRRLRSLLHQLDKVDAWKGAMIAGLQDIMSDIIKTIHSLRSSVATEGLCLIQDIGVTLGDSLNAYTLEIILTNLLKCSSVTKKMIATKAAQVTNLFLSNTQFHTKIVMLLCKTINEKNVQLRQYAATYIKTILETHGSKDAIRSVIAEKLEVSQSIESFLRKGLADGSPHVREASRQTYSVYYDYWPDAAEKLLRSLDSSVQRLLEKNSPKSSPKPTSRPRMLSSRSNSMSSVSSKTSTSTAAT
ncbi:suppressor of tub2 mutation, partial [Rhizopus stolonifer]